MDDVLGDTEDLITIEGIKTKIQFHAGSKNREREWVLIYSRDCGNNPQVAQQE